MYITLKHDAACKDCGATLPAGTKARWFRNGDVYGDTCHRWQIKLTAKQIERVQAAVKNIMTASKHRPIPAEVSDRIVSLTTNFERRIDRKNMNAVIAELNSIKDQLCQLQ